MPVRFNYQHLHTNSQDMSDPPLLMDWEVIGTPAMIEMLHLERKRPDLSRLAQTKQTDYDELAKAYDKYRAEEDARQRRKMLRVAMEKCYAAYLLGTTTKTRPDDIQSDAVKVETDTA